MNVSIFHYTIHRFSQQTSAVFWQKVDRGRDAVTRQHKILLSLITILAITYTAFYPSLHNNFINLDDGGYVLKNSHITSLSAHHLRRIFTSFYVGNYQPISTLTYMADYRLFKLNPFGYHLSALLWHCANGLLVFWFIFLLTGGRIGMALVTALLFSIHPLRVESVAWVSERKDVCYVFFFLASLISYLYYVRSARRPRAARFYYLSLACFLLSLLSKGMAMTLPIALFLLDYHNGRRFDKDTLKEKIPFLALAAGGAILAIYSQHLGVRVEDQADLMYKLIVSGYAVIFYLKKILLPTGLSAYYLYCGPGNIYEHPVFLYYYLTCLACAALLLIGRRFSKILTFGALFFASNLLPVLQYFPFGKTIVADRYTYVASVGITYALVWGASRLLQRGRYLRAHAIKISATLSACIIISLAFGTWSRCGVWHDSLSLWGDVLKSYPNSITALLNRGRYFYDTKEYDRSISECDKAIAVNPEYGESYVSRGLSFFAKSDYARAEADYDKAVMLNPSYAKAWHCRAMLQQKKGQYDKAVQGYTKAIELDKKYSAAYLYRGFIYDDVLHAPDKALADFTGAIKADPNNAAAYYSRGVTEYRMGSFAPAIVDFSNAIELEASHADAYNNRAIAYWYQGAYDKCRADIEALKRMGAPVNTKLLNRMKEMTQ